MAAIKVLYEDEHLIVVNKPAGLLVHPGHGRTGETTLLDLLFDHLQFKPFLVHRLDRDTSGAIIVAKDNQTKLFLQKQFARRQVKKTYLGLVVGKPKHQQALLDLPIGRHPKNPLRRAVIGSGRPAQTFYRVLSEYRGYSLLELEPKTGRTHQIRVHLAYIGHPLVGDTLYGSAALGLNRQFLHAHKLSLKLPTGNEQLFTAPLPIELKRYLTKLELVTAV